LTHKIILILALVAVAIFAYWKRDSIISMLKKNDAPVNTASASTNNPNPQEGSTQSTSSTGFSGKVDVLASTDSPTAPTVFDQASNIFTGFFGNTLGLVTRFANFGELTASMTPTAKYQSAQVIVNLKNNVKDKIKFTCLVQAKDLNSQVEALQSQTVELEPLATVDVGFFLSPLQGGSTIIEVFNWTELTNPTPVTNKLSKTIVVQG